jgi:hypothetical protein
MVLALLLIAAQGAQTWWNRRGAKAARETQTAVLQGATEEQTILILSSINGLKSQVSGLSVALEAQKLMAAVDKTELADHAVRLVEHKRRLDGHDVDVAELRERVVTIEKGRK